MAAQPTEARLMPVLTVYLLASACIPVPLVADAAAPPDATNARQKAWNNDFMPLARLDGACTSSLEKRRFTKRRSAATGRSAAAAFIDPAPLQFRTAPPFLQSSSSLITSAQSSSNDTPSKDSGGGDDPSPVKVGSSDYYKGFVSRSIDEEPTERITGQAVLGPTLKFAGGAAIILMLLTAGFLASNGII